MFTKIAGIVTSTLVLVVSAAAAWSQFETSAVNSLVTEANGHFETAAKLHNEAAPKFTELQGSLRSLPVDRSELDPRIAGLAKTYAESAAEYRLAAAKIAEAGMKSSDPIVTSYFTAKSRRWTACAAIRESIREYLTLSADPTVRTAKDYSIRQEEINKRVDELNRQDKELEAEADKIHSDNRSKFG
jgi:Skp family chaperone for outer membrane proteins